MSYFLPQHDLRFHLSHKLICFPLTERDHIRMPSELIFNRVCAQTVNDEMVLGMSSVANSITNKQHTNFLSNSFRKSAQHIQENREILQSIPDFICQ
jgi:hypothetical protein